MFAAIGKSDLEIEPSLITYKIKSEETVLSNITTNTVTVNPHSLLCKVHIVTVQSFPVHNNTHTASDLLSKID